MKRENTNSIFAKKKWLAGVLVACLLIFMCAGCGAKNKLVITSGLSKNEVFGIGEEVCTVPELMVYMTNLQNQYETAFGDQVWELAHGEISMEDNIKEIALEQMAQLKAMYLLAQKHSVVLDGLEQQKVKKAAEMYYASLNDTERELMNVEYETIERLYEMYTLAQKVYRVVIKDVNPEISDDEARTITVQQIFWPTTGLSEAQKQSVYEDAQDVRRMALDDEQEFIDLAGKYSKDSNITHSFCKGEREEEIEEVAFMLATNEISRIIEGDRGYYLLKCITTFDEQQTLANKEKIAEERKKEIFSKEYNEFVATLVPQLNKNCWKKISLIHDENVTTSNFFDVYEEYCPKY